MRGPALVLVAAALVGCTSGGPDEPAPPRASPDLAVTVQQQRVDATTRIVGVEVTNREDAPVQVAAVRLRGGGLDGPVTTVDTELRPDLTVALRTSYGRPACADRSQPVVAELEIAGAWIAYDVDSAGQQEVGRLLDTDCARIALAEKARVQLTGPYRVTSYRGRPWLHGFLVMSRRSSETPVDLRSVAGTVLVDLRPVRDLVDLESDADRAVTEILLGSTGRCDPHALGQSTQTFLLSAYVRLGQETEQRIVLVPPPSVQDRVLKVIDRACATSPR